MHSDFLPIEPWLDLVTDGAQAACFETFAAQARAIAHAVGNPLSGLSLSFELLEASRDPASQARYLARCKAACERLLTLQHELSAMGSEASEQPADVSTAQLLERARALAGGGSVPSAVEVNSRAEHLWGRPTQLALATAELLRNAQRATGGQAGNAAWGVHVERKQQLWQLCVWDEGCGVSDYALPRLFRRACRAHAAHLGIGLLRAALVTERYHGGRVGYRPRQQGGSEFFLAIPAA